MKKPRPVNLDLQTIKFPPMAIASIMHRLSGVLLALLIPVVLFLMMLSLKSKSSFLMLQSYLLHPVSKFFIWGCVTALLYHLLAGIRHMIMDMGWGETVSAAKTSSFILFALAAIVAIFVGVWLW